MASVSWSEAHQAIGAAVSDFFDTVLGTSQRARASMNARSYYTERLLAPFISAQALEASQWCEQSQQISAPNVTTAYSIKVDVCSNAASFDLKYPSVDGSSKAVVLVDQTEHSLNPTDSSLTTVAATEIDCKSVTQAGLIKAFGEHGDAAEDSCTLANVQAIVTARKLLAGSASLQRYDTEGKAIVVDADEKYSTGVTWQAARFGFHTDEQHVIVQSPRLVTGSTMLCKLLSPSRAIEYMMVDGLPKFDGSVP
eukprot:TRINITY_DN2552_c0_g1_i11.p1 TRINITY_DN2552_c0_g1~~TRINITY_DN2552_c0_g1_i11.p1  ORF type:complete len:253 (+),score=63.95 TRINITY_DN2552_c0_g1_i11:433-1191(+)